MFFEIDENQYKVCLTNKTSDIFLALFGDNTETYNGIDIEEVCSWFGGRGTIDIDGKNYVKFNDGTMVIIDRENDEIEVR